MATLRHKRTSTTTAGGLVTQSVMKTVTVHTAAAAQSTSCGGAAVELTVLLATE